MTPDRMQGIPVKPLPVHPKPTFIDDPFVDWNETFWLLLPKLI